MARSPFSTLAVAAIALAACNSVPPQPGNAATPVEAASAADPSGRYARTQPSNGTLDITREGAGWRLRVQAAGLPNGPGTAADCELVAVGPLVDGRIAGRLVPFTGQFGDISASEIGDPPGTITATVKGDTVDLAERNASFKLCGLGSDLSGTYTKS